MISTICERSTLRPLFYYIFQTTTPVPLFHHYHTDSTTILPKFFYLTALKSVHTEAYA